jgi:hypothetical protein
MMGVFGRGRHGHLSWSRKETGTDSATDNGVGHAFHFGWMVMGESWYFLVCAWLLGNSAVQEQHDCEMSSSCANKQQLLTRSSYISIHPTTQLHPLCEYVFGRDQDKSKK